MSKVFLISFDDGSVWDPRLVALLNQYGMKGTFNLNSGLEDFVWEFEGFPVRRQKLSQVGDLYRGHEVASHSLHHPWLNSLTPPQLRKEVGEDCANLKVLFGLEEIGFGVPFTACGEREIRLIQKYLRYIRLSEFSDSFALPKDPYHIPIHALYNQEDVKDRIAAFAASPLSDGLFVLAGHSYELEALGHWDCMETLLQYIQAFGFVSMTTMEFVNRYYPKEETQCMKY